ncbi:MAG TPA: alpha/beta hydrolase [Actinopolymorphaceae bacterium]|nr:alpha/beta hydrolase [Actinopolymorphaceae bacterium]
MRQPSVVVARRPRPGHGRPCFSCPDGPGSKEDFLGVLAPLAAASSSRVIAVDLRGQYESQGHDDPSAYSLERLGRDVVAMARGLDEQRIHLVGHSFGGLVARSAVLEEPREFASLTLLCSGPAGIRGPSVEVLRMMAEAIPTNGLAAVYAALRQLERSRGPADAAPTAVDDFYRRRFCANHPVSLAEFTRQLVDAPDRVVELAGCKVPTLVAYGADIGAPEPTARVHETWTVARQREMAERLGAVHTGIPGAGRSPALDRPDATARALTAFWAAVAGETPQRIGRSAP